VSEEEGQDATSGGEQAGRQAAPETGRAGGGQGGYVLDASALLCLINGEPGADRVAAVLPRAVVSAVNLAEVATKLSDLGADVETARALLAPLHLVVAPFDEGAAFATGALRAATRDQGLSLGDRACLALAAERGATALTADKVWQGVSEPVGVPVELIR
jgi:PIN domain nuclease of toxin-antitoxin system